MASENVIEPGVDPNRIEGAVAPQHQGERRVGAEERRSDLGRRTNGRCPGPRVEVEEVVVRADRNRRGDHRTGLVDRAEHMANGPEGSRRDLSAAGDEYPVGDGQAIEPDVGLDRLTSSQPRCEPDSVDGCDHCVQAHQRGQGRVGQDGEHRRDRIVFFIQRHDDADRSR